MPNERRTIESFSYAEYQGSQRETAENFSYIEYIDTKRNISANFAYVEWILPPWRTLEELAYAEYVGSIREVDAQLTYVEYEDQKRNINELFYYAEWEPLNRITELFSYVEYEDNLRKISEELTYIEYVNQDRKAIEVFSYVEYTGGAASYTSTDHQPVYMEGGSRSTDHQPVYLKGATSTSDHQPVYLFGGNLVTDNQPAYLSVIATITDHQPVYIRGKLTSVDNQPAYMTALPGCTNNLPVYMSALGTTSDNQEVYLYGYPTPGLPDYVNVEITLDGNDITNLVLDYSREQNICNGVATLRVATVPLGYYPTTYDEIILYESGVRRGKFYVKSYTTDHTGKLVIDAQDASKKLMDHFITQQESLNYVTTARYWIEKYLQEAHVSYTINSTSSGAPITPDSVFGFESAYDIIMQLLQMSNWYMYFNQNGRAIIGQLSVRSGRPHATITDSTALNIGTNTNDKMLRNRAVVWGGADIITGQWIYADITVITRYNYDENDKRTIVLSNSYVQTYGQAYTLARQILNEFNTLTYEKTVKVAGALNVHIGDYVMINSSFFRGGGIVTTISSELNESGMTTILVIDQRCPRLFAFFSDFDDYVYIGTDGNGVWRKPLDSDGWEDYSTGITDLKITDLSINGNVFATTTAGGVGYRRTLLESSWTPMVPTISGVLPSGVMIASGISASGIYAVACSVDKVNSNIYYGYVTNSGVLSSGFLYNGQLPAGSGNSWVVTFSNTGQFLRSDKITLTSSGVTPSGITTSGVIDNITILDLDNSGEEQIVVVMREGVGYPAITATGVIFNQGYFQETLVPNTRVYAVGPAIPEGYDEFGDPVTMDSIKAESLGATDYGLNQPIITFSDEWTAYIDVSNNKIYEVRMNSTATALEETAYDISGFSAYHTEAYWTNYQLFRTDDPDVYTIGMYGIVTQIGRPDVDYFKTISVNKQTGSLSLVSSGSIDLGFNGSGFNQWNLLAGELFVRISIERRWDGSMAKLYYRIGAINLRTGQSYYAVDQLLEDGAVAGRLAAVDIGTPGDGFIGHTQDANGLPIISWARVGVVETEFDPISLIHREELYLYTGQIKASSLPTALGKEKCEEIRGLVSNTYYTLGIRGWKERGWDIEKKYNHWVYMLGKYLFGTLFYEDKSCTLPYLSLGTGSYLDGSTEIPLAIQNPYRSLVQVDASTYLLGGTIPLQIPVDSVFPAPGPYRAYNIPSDSICVDADVNDGCIYGIVYKYQPGLEQYGYNYLCGWKQDGTMVKRYFTWLSGQVTDQLYVMNQYAILRYYSVAYGFRFLFIRFDEASILDPSLYSAVSVLRQNPEPDSFTVLYDYPARLWLDISKSAPTVVYTQTPSGQTSVVATSWDNAVGSFVPATTAFPVYDVRTFDVGDLTQFYVESGVITSSGLAGFRYLAMATDTGLVVVDALTLSGAAILTTMSGLGVGSGLGTTMSGLRKIETTNYSATTPYFFATGGSGIAPSGITESGGGSFWQRNPGASTWNSYVQSIPPSTITIIRTDDRI